MKESPMNNDKQVEAVLRRVMRRYNIQHTSWACRPSYPNSYKWPPPGKPYTHHQLVRKGKLRRVTREDVPHLSTDNRSYGADTHIVYGVPTIGGQKDKKEQAYLRKIKSELAKLGFSCG